LHSDGIFFCNLYQTCNVRLVSLSVGEILLCDGGLTVLWYHSQRSTLIDYRQQWLDGRLRAFDCVAATSWRKLLPRSCATVVLLLDLETTGVDVANDQIVEFAAYHAPTERHVRGAAFSTVVKPSVEDSAGHIHGIGPNELSQGLPFGVAWSRFLDFVVGLPRIVDRFC
jgi:hypothetical protein